MNNSQQPCNPEMISCFYDNELTTDQRSWIASHVQTCDACQHSLQNLSSLSRHVVHEIGDQFHNMSVDIEHQLMKSLSIQKKQSISIEKGFYFFKWGKILIPATVMAGLLILFFTFWIQLSKTVPAPSAIIHSISGNHLSSVMIMETPSSHHTIVWIQEKV
ncbi:MAG: zf-HC2 domain-containing protein [Desulfobacterales bacterium]|nr:zf-HC2 domain-containing protein [Desulfobacterales bacterium]